ncbi:MAG: p16 [Bacillales bacterium]|jgi:phage-related protein|nr:p16 [Bacillales bacterium]
MIIKSLDNVQFDLETNGIEVLKLEIDEISPRHTTEVFEGLDGHIDIDTTYDGRTMRVSFFMDNYSESKSQLFDLINGKKYFYIIDELEPDKRYKVKAASKPKTERIGQSAKVEVELISNSPFAESVKTTKESLYLSGTYTHSTNTFSIYNGSDIEIDPRVLPLLIEFNGPATNLKITNNTNGDEWLYNGSVTTGNTVKLDGIRSLINETSILGYTNKKLIRLDKGWNNFEVSGTTGAFTISFDFRFYYF